MQKSVLITDVDNTLLDWFDVWHESFSRLLAVAEQILETPREELYPDISLIHQKYGTSEYAFLVEELAEIRGIKADQAREVVEKANKAFAIGRSKSLKLYPRVKETLVSLKE